MSVKKDGLVGRAVAKVSASPTFAKVAPKIVPPIDRFLHKVSGGRILMSQGMLPTLVLTHTGAKSGQQRTTPLATMPDGKEWLVIGSNFGRENHPAWTANLLANPEATVSYQGKTVPVTARLIEGDERAELWPRIVTFWPNYEKYVERSGRELRVFRLTPR